MRKLAALAAIATLVLLPILGQASSRHLKTQAPIKWVKADGAGNTTYDSVAVNIPHTADLGGDAADTTEWFDLSQIQFPVKEVANDSMAVVYAYLHWVGSAAGDTMRIQAQTSPDAVAVTSLNVANLIGVATHSVSSIRATNVVAAADGHRFVRWIVTNFDVAGGGVVHLFKLSPAYWTGD
ncbi:MAG: hypothetical protein A2W26_00075 [Acidobacteria bacterium RBG_16_64_8]|nr:MAG: hypothetical protein A2W26_00075 [Acidobacteria bacterium RBG_16_64_8]